MDMGIKKLIYKKYKNNNRANFRLSLSRNNLITVGILNIRRLLIHKHFQINQRNIREISNNNIHNKETKMTVFPILTQISIEKSLKIKVIFHINCKSLNKK